MSKKHFIQELSQDWNFGVYPLLLEVTRKSFSIRPLRGPAFLISVRERAFASTVCTLAAFQAESMLQNIAYKKGKKDDSRHELVKLICNLKLQQAVLELFIMRDVIAHSHLHKTIINFKQDGDPKSSYSKKVRGYDSKDYKLLVVRNKTKLLQFNVAPSRIGFTDSVLALILSNRLAKELGITTKDFYIHKITEDGGYQSIKLTDYIKFLTQGLNNSHKNSLQRKLAFVNKV